MNNRLFWKISLMLFGILLCLGLAFALISVDNSRAYYLETNQKLYGDLAAHTVQEVKPLINGKVDTNAIQKIMHSMMTINPSVEVYLLNTQGEIITYVAPYKKVVLEKVDLVPIKHFIAQTEITECILGDDPRFPGQRNIFSAALIEREGITEGYVYIVLASEKQTDISGVLARSYILKSGLLLFLTISAAALLIGLLAIWLITRNLNHITNVFQKFKDGDYTARIDSQTGKDLKVVSTTFNEMADQIAQNIESMESVETLRKELIANVSHDLRTPLAIMRGYVETLQLKGSLLSTVEKEKYLTIILDSTEKLSDLVTQLFEYSKLEANEIKPLKEPFSLSDLVQDSLQKYTMLLEKRNINIETKFELHTPLVYGDVSLIERVIQNLVDNAIKFTPENGKIVIDIHADKENVACSITDTGPGIPHNEQREIFERFKQVKTTSGGKEGAGLGLAIVKKIVDMHSSKIVVKSEPNNGASFIFSLPQYLMAQKNNSLELA